MDGAGSHPSSTAANIARIVNIQEDCDALLQTWNVLLAAGAQKWEIDTPEPCALRMRITGICKFDINVYREVVSTVSTLRDVIVSVDGVDVWLWKHEFKTRSPHLAVPAHRYPVPSRKNNY